MLKAKVRKSLSVLLSATMLASMFTSFAAVASADNNDGAAEAAQVTGVQTFTEDFSSYTAETAPTAGVGMSDDKAGQVAVTHPSGAQWKIPQTKAARAADNYGNTGAYWFELDSAKPENNVLKIKGMAGWGRSSLNLDTDNAFKVDEFKEFRFSTIACGESIGTRLFVNESENKYLEFAVSGYRNTATEGGNVPAHMPKVIYAHGGTREILYNAGAVVDDTTQGAKDGWKEIGNGDAVHVAWTIKVNEDKSLTWEARTKQGGKYTADEAVSTGTIPAEIAVPLMDDYRYPLAATGDGDTQWGKYESVSFDYTVDNTTSFVEDFSSYTAETVATSNTTAPNGAVLATHPSGSTWVVGKQATGNGTAQSAYRFDVNNDRLHLKGWGNSWNDLNVDLHLDPSVKIKSLKRFKFTTYLQEEDLGVRLFMNNSHNAYIEFGMAGSRRSGENAASYPKYMPYVILKNGETSSQEFSSATAVGDTTQGLKDGWTTTRNAAFIEVDWTVNVNADGSLSWSAVSSYASSMGTISAEKAAPIMNAYTYPVTLIGYGDQMNSAYKKVQIDYVPDNTETFVEDFSSYTANDVATSNVALTADKALQTVATHPSGAKWKVPATQTTQGYNYGFYRFDVGSDSLHIRSWGEHRRAALNLDISNTIGVERFEEFTFETYSRGQGVGARLFTDSAETSYLEFSIASERNPSGTEDGTYPKEMPKVVLVNNGTRTPIFNAGTVVGETTQGAMDGWKDVDQTVVKWTIKLNEDNSINWEVVTTGGNYALGAAKSSGTISADVVAPLLANYRYPISVTGDGDSSGWNDSWVYNVGFKYVPDKDFVAPDFHEDFTEYKADDNTVTEPFLIQNNRKVLGTHSSGAKWITSNKNSYAGNSSYSGSAYIDVANNRVATKGWGTYHLQKVLLDYSDKKYDVKKVKFTSLLGEHEAALTGLTMFVDGQNENNYLFFGQMRENTSAFGLTGATNKKYAPVIVKVVNGTATPLVYTSADDTESAWNVNDKEATWTIEFDENNNVNWTVTSSRGTTASGTIENDEDVKKLASANWAYPLASIACGDNYSFIKSVDMWTTEPQDLVYEKKAYTRAEFMALFNDAVYGKPGDVEKLMKLDLSEVDGGTADATVTVGTSTKSVSTKLFGSHTEYSSGYEGMADANGNITDEFKAAAEKIAPIATYRLGGGSTTSKNMLKDLNNEDSYYLSASELPSHMQEKAGQLSFAHQTQDAATLINAALANNPSASFNLCISPYTTTPEEVAQLITNLTGSDSSYRLAYGLPEAPIKLESIELGNELEHFGDYTKSAEFATWYGDRMPAYISAIEGAAPSLRIIANGMTCPWSGVGSYGFWLDMITATRTVGSDTNYRIVDHIDNISFHPYYDYGNMGNTSLLDVVGTMKSYLDTKAPGNNVKFIITEHGVGWRSDDGLFANYETSAFKAALINSAFAAEAAKRDYIEPIMYNHGTYGTLWQRINDNTISPLGEVYSLLTKEWKDTAVDTNVEVTDDVVGTYSNYFTASTVKSSANEIKVILTNAADYKSVNTTFNLPANYTLVNEKVMKAPNPFTATYNENCQDLVKTTSNDVEVKNFSSYEVPASSIVVLTLQIPDGKSEFAENFDYDNVEVEASTAASQVAANANGAKWMTSAANNGAVEADWETTFDDSFGKVEIANGALKISNTAASDKATSANWDISAVSEKPSDISEISFTVTGANGGVKLFADSNESSKFDFSNKTVGLTGTVNWTIAIADGTLTWTAKNGVDTKTGTIAVSASDLTGYTYLASAYLSSGVAESATFDNFLFRYGSAEEPTLEGVTYVNNTNTVDVTVNPSVYGKTSARVLVGYYNGDALVSANTTVVTADGQTFNSAKPSTTYTKAVIFVWDEATQAPLADETPVN